MTHWHVRETDFSGHNFFCIKRWNFSSNYSNCFISCRILVDISTLATVYFPHFPFMQLLYYVLNYPVFLKYGYTFFVILNEVIEKENYKGNIFRPFNCKFTDNRHNPLVGGNLLMLKWIILVWTQHHLWCHSPVTLSESNKEQGDENKHCS